VTIRFGDRRPHVLDHRQRGRSVWIDRCRPGSSQALVISHGGDQRQRGQINVSIDVVDGLNRVIEEVEQEREPDSGQQRQNESDENRLHTRRTDWPSRQAAIVFDGNFRPGFA